MVFKVSMASFTGLRCRPFGWCDSGERVRSVLRSACRGRAV